jgi:hypothetical protein
MDQAAKSVKSSANALNSSVRALEGLGMDTGTLTLIAASMQGISGLSEGAKGLIAICTTIRTYKAAEIAINIPKWGIYAPFVAAGAYAAGYAAGKYIDNIVDVVREGSYSTPSGRRELSAEVYSYGR